MGSPKNAKLVQYWIINAICNLLCNCLKKKNHIDAQKALKKIQYSFTIKKLSKPELAGNFLILIKSICRKLMANIICNDESRRLSP